MKELETRICTSCLRDVQVLSAPTFLGFRRFLCPECGIVQKHPLNAARKIFYMLFLATIGTLCVYLVARGQVPVPGVIPILTAVALASNVGLAAEVREARRKQAMRGTAHVGRL